MIFAVLSIDNVARESEAQPVACSTGRTLRDDGGTPSAAARLHRRRSVAGESLWLAGRFCNQYRQADRRYRDGRFDMCRLPHRRDYLRQQDLTRKRLTPVV